MTLTAYQLQTTEDFRRALFREILVDAVLSGILQIYLLQGDDHYASRRGDRSRPIMPNTSTMIMFFDRGTSLLLLVFGPEGVFIFIFVLVIYC